MASELIAMLAASALVSAAAPAHTDTVAPAKTGYVTSVAPRASGVCMVPAAKGKVTKLSAIRKARDGRSCSFQLMQEGAAGAAAGAGGGIAGSTLATTAITVGVSVGASVGINQAIDNGNSTPNP